MAKGGLLPVQSDVPLGTPMRFPKALVHQILGYRTYAPEVEAFHRSSARVRIVNAPARTSKSYSAAYDAIPELMPEFEFVETAEGKPEMAPVGASRRCWIVGPDYRTIKEWDYLWIELVERQHKHAMPYRVTRKNNAPQQGNMLLELTWGRNREGDMVRTWIEGKSAGVPESLQGEEIDLWIGSEAAEHNEKTWSRYGSTRSRRAIFPTTPKLSAQWLKDMIDLGSSVSHLRACDPPACAPECPIQRLGIEVFNYTPAANPSYDWTRFWQEHTKAESRADQPQLTEPADLTAPCGEANGHDCFDPAFGCVAMSDPWFAEQFGGRWTGETERVLPFRWSGRHSHILHTVPDWWEHAKYYVAMDYGFADPSCVHWYAVGTDGTILIYRELYETGLTARDLVAKIHDTTQLFGERIEYYVGDPQNPQVNRYLNERGLRTYVRDRARMRDRAAGGMRVLDALSVDPAVGQPGLFVLSERCGPGFGCPKTILEWQRLRRKEGVSQNEWGVGANAGHDHAYDTLRYFLSSRPSAPRESDFCISERFRQHADESERRRRARGALALSGPHPALLAGRTW